MPITAAAPVPVLVPNVWPAWNQQVYLQTTAATTSTVVWAAWNQNCTTTGATQAVPVLIPAATVWQNWNQGYYITGTGDPQVLRMRVTGTWTEWNTAHEETAEQRQAREQRQAEAALRAR